jgi:hypothetical protein
MVGNTGPRKQSRLRGGVYTVVGGVGMFVGALASLAVMFTLPQAYSEGWVTLPWWSLPIAVLVLGSPAVGLFKGGRRLTLAGRMNRARVVADHRQLAPHTFVLYLRPFSFDERLGGFSVDTTNGYSTFASVMTSRHTDEEQLALAFRSIGPVVAVGQPDEQLPRAGARRLYIEDSEWQQVVEALIRRARVVVLGLGTGAHLLWELKTTCRHVPPERIVLIVRHAPEAYGEVRAVVAPLLPRGLPDYPPAVKASWWTGQFWLGNASLRGAIWFDADWTAHFVRFDSATSRANVLSPMESVVAFGLRPVFERFPGRGPAPRRGYMTRRQRRKIALFTATLVLGCFALATIAALLGV